MIKSNNKYFPFSFVIFVVISLFLTNFLITTLAHCSPVTKKIPFEITSSCNDEASKKLYNKIQKAIVNEYRADYDTEKLVVKFRSAFPNESKILINLECTPKEALLIETTSITVQWYYVDSSNKKTLLSTVTADQKNTRYHIKKSYNQIIDSTSRILKNNKIIPN